MDITSLTQPHGGKSKGTTCAVDRDETAYMAVDRVLLLSTESKRSVPTELRKRKKIHCSKDLKEQCTIFPYIAVLNTPKFTPPPQFKDNPQRSRAFVSFLSFEKCLEVTDYKKFEAGNILPKSMEHVLHFF